MWTTSRSTPLTSATSPRTGGFWNLVGFYNDSEEWIEGKQAPMYAAYAEAASTSDALRTLLSNLRPKAHIILPDAPKIGMEYSYRPSSYNLLETLLVVFGVCPAAHCDAANNFHFHEARDLYVPSVSEGQAEAIVEMRGTMSDDYWVREAHANGIYGIDPEIRQSAALNREMLTPKFEFAPSNSRFWVCIEFGYLFLVFTTVICFIIRIYRCIHPSRVKTFANEMSTVASSTHSKPSRVTAKTQEQRTPLGEEERQQISQQDQNQPPLEREEAKGCKPT